jgi:soluble lytic murein transglycosylase
MLDAIFNKSMFEKSGQIAIMLVLALILVQVEAGRAEVYHFTDREGVLHFTNVPTDPRYKRLMITDGSVRSYVSPKQLSLILRTIEKSAEKFDLEPALVKAVIKTESDFNPMAVSSAGAMGLMQLMPQTATRWSVNNPMDPVENIWGGVRYLRHLLDLFDGQLSLAIAAYHAGEDRVQGTWNIPPIPATQEYVNRVLKHYKKYRGDRAPRNMIYKVTMTTGEVVYTDNPQRYQENGPPKSNAAIFR